MYLFNWNKYLNEVVIDHTVTFRQFNCLMKLRSVEVVLVPSWTPSLTAPITRCCSCGPTDYISTIGWYHTCITRRYSWSRMVWCHTVIHIIYWISRRCCRTAIRTWPCDRSSTAGLSCFCAISCIQYRWPGSTGNYCCWPSSITIKYF